MKVKHKNKNKVLLKPVNVSKKRNALLKSFRTYKNYQKFGVKDRSAVKQRLKMRGRGESGQADKTVEGGKSGGQKNYVTDNDSVWIKKLNPYDKLIANKSIKTLNGINKLIGQFDPDLQSDDFASQVKNLTAIKSKIVQTVLGYTGRNPESVGEALKNTFKDIGLTLVGKGWLWESGQEKLESVTERKQKIVAALDDVLNQARNKGQEALSQLNQLYLKQGDREEQQQIRDKEEKKQDEKNEKIREKDKIESLPEYQTVEEVNPLGFVSGRRYMRVNPNNESQVRSVRSNPFIREQDKSYYNNNQKIKNVSFEAHKNPPVVVNNEVHRQKVLQDAMQKRQQQNQQGPSGTW